MKKVLVTGGNGYIGAHVIKKLALHGGFDISNIDYRPLNDTPNNVEKYCYKTYNDDLTSEDYFEMYHIDYDAIIHLAAFISVEESVERPLKYYQNNINSTINLLQKEFGRYDHFLFASTGAAFDPTNPYATSKIVCEDIVKFKAANKFTNFRFFNVSGLDTEFHPTGNPTHLIRRAAMAAAGKIEKLTIFGTDFDTRDGTCIRDYVHVNDLANTIVKLVENGPVCTPYECIGSGTGYTVREIVTAMEKVVGKSINISEGPRRAGDAPVTLTPSVSTFMKAEHTIEDMCLSAYNHERNS